MWQRKKDWGKKYKNEKKNTSNTKIDRWENVPIPFFYTFTLSGYCGWIKKKNNMGKKIKKEKENEKIPPEKKSNNKKKKIRKWQNDGWFIYIQLWRYLSSWLYKQPMGICIKDISIN